PRRPGRVGRWRPGPARTAAGPPATARQVAEGCTDAHSATDLRGPDLRPGGTCRRGGGRPRHRGHLVLAQRRAERTRARAEAQDGRPHRRDRDRGAGERPAGVHGSQTVGLVALLLAAALAAALVRARRAFNREI